MLTLLWLVLTNWTNQERSIQMIHFDDTCVKFLFDTYIF